MDISIKEELLITTASTLFLLLALILLHRYLFLRPLPSNIILQTLQERLRNWFLMFVFLIPARWVCSRLHMPEGYIQTIDTLLACFTAVIIVETVLSFLFGYFAVEKPRASRFVRVSIRILIYSLLLILFIMLKRKDSEIQMFSFYEIVSIFITYLILHLIYTYFFKWMQWKHPLALALSVRLRIFVYLIMLCAVAYYALLGFDIFRALLIKSLSSIQAYFRLAFMVLSLLITFEALLTIAFDYVFPVIRKIDVPGLFRDLFRVIIYFGITIFSIGAMLKQDLSTLLLGSTVASVILGLALQETLGNFFAGLALGLAKPYNIGDSVQIGDMAGRVEKIDWRATAILTQSGDYINVPNSVLSKVQVQNFSAPTTLHARLIDVGVHYRHPPNTVKNALLQAAQSVEEVSSEPGPIVWLIDFQDSAMLYRLRIWINDYSARFTIESKVREAIWYKLSRERIEIPFPIRNVIHTRSQVSPAVDLDIRAMLGNIDFLQVLGDKDLDILTEIVHHQLYAKSEKICQQGDHGESFYIIKSGRLLVSARNELGETYLSKEMHSGQYFGEMALLTGDPRSATVEAQEDSELLMLSKADLRNIIHSNPDAERLISNVLAIRQLRTQKALEDYEEKKESAFETEENASMEKRLEELSANILCKIRDFFSY